MNVDFMYFHYNVVYQFLCEKTSSKVNLRILTNGDNNIFIIIEKRYTKGGGRTKKQF